VLQSLVLTEGLPGETIRQLDAFRKKRNLTGYERVGAVSDREADEITRLAGTIRRQVEDWIKAAHTELL